jgi:predicted TIM-barrel fold metal-dependent hydrolase
MTSNSASSLYQELYQRTAGHSLINTHSHHLPEAEFASYDLDILLRNSYVNWCGVSFDSTPESRSHFLERVRYQSYFVWLQKSLQELYAFSEPLSVTNWDRISAQIQQAHHEPGRQSSLLTGQCAYRKIVQDAYWDPGSDNGNPAIFTPSFRINAFHFGYAPWTTDQDGNSPYTLYPRPFITDLDEYLGWVRQKIIEKKSQGCVALKLPIAYDRGLDFAEIPYDLAQAAFGRLVAAFLKVPMKPQLAQPLDSASSIISNAPLQPPLELPPVPGVTQADIKAFQDFLFFQICRLAAELDLPVQVHTGMGQGRRTNALWLQEVIQHNPHTRFVLLHGSYPWIEDIPALLRLYPNVFADLCWLPLGSTRAGKFLLHELIENANSNKVMWGCDTWTAEESYGALLSLRFVLCSVLAEKVSEGYLTAQDANQIIDNILYRNAADFFRLKIV